MSLNLVILNGFVGKAPEVKTLESGVKVATFTVATTERGFTTKAGKEIPDKTTWHNITAIGNIVKIVEPYVNKGDFIGVIGKISQREYTNSEGKKSYFHEVIANEIQLFPSQKSRTDGQSSEQQEGFQYAKPTPPINSSQYTGEPQTYQQEDDLPF